MSGKKDRMQQDVRAEIDSALRMSARDSQLVSDARMRALAEKHYWAGWSLALIVATLCALLGWASWARLEEVTAGAGVVVPVTREQTVQSVDGGVLQEVLVREGDNVALGQVLARMNTLRSESYVKEGQVKADALRAAAARLAAEANGGLPVFSNDLRKQRPELVEAERRSFESRRMAQEELAATRYKGLQLARQELMITEPLVEKGLVSEVELIRLKRQVSELQGQIRELNNRARAEAAAELTKVNSELAAMSETVTGRQDQLRQAVIKAPAKGIVKNVKYGSGGAVLRPGEELMQIIPTSDRLLVEARIRPSDVAFLRPGLRTKVKISAYDYTVYGTLGGAIEQISPDTVPDETRRGESYYRVRVRTDAGSLQGRDGKTLPIIPGMTATVEVLTGGKTVLDYLLKPVLKSRDALRER